MAERARADLHQAARDGDVDAIWDCLNLGADIDELDEFDCTPLMCAVEMNRLTAAQKLLDKGANAGYAKPWVGTTVLHLAASALIMKQILSSSTNVASLLNARRHNGQAPLHTAAKAGREAIVKLLLEAGADPTVVDSAGMTPAQAASQAAVAHVAAFSAGHFQLGHEGFQVSKVEAVVAILNDAVAARGGAPARETAALGAISLSSGSGSASDACDPDFVFKYITGADRMNQVEAVLKAIDRQRGLTRDAPLKPTRSDGATGADVDLSGRIQGRDEKNSKVCVVA